MTIGEALRAAQTRLAAASDSPRADAELLLSEVTGLGRARLLAYPEQALSHEAAARFEALLARRADGVPVAYLTGRKGFWTLDLNVTPDVLVPRPETELLVTWGLDCLARATAPRVADLGTGSGAIALALASERPDAHIDASDASPAALEVARGNASRLRLCNLTFLLGHWYAPLGDAAYDLLVSNPPYIARDDDHLPALRHEPLAALSDGGDGLGALREIAAGAPARLRPGGWLLVEHGYDQGASVRQLLVEAGFEAVETRRDYGGQERASGGRVGGGVFGKSYDE